MSDFEKHTLKALKAVQRGEDIPGAVFMPPALRNDKSVIYAYVGEPPTVEDEIIRIQQEADPVGLLIAIATGQPVATYSIVVSDDGAMSVKTDYETLPLDNPIRERIIKDLAAKIMPRLSVRKRDQGDVGGEQGDPEWEATAAAAAERFEDDG